MTTALRLGFPLILNCSDNYSENDRRVSVLDEAASLSLFSTPWKFEQFCEDDKRHKLQTCTNGR